MKSLVAQPPSAAQPAKRAKHPAAPAAAQFGKTVKARELWGPEHVVHLHQHIRPHEPVEIIGSSGAFHRRIHTPRRVARTQ